MKTSTLSRTLRHAAAAASVGAALALAAGTASAGQLIYTPVNPSFGGNPLNGSYLLSIANQANQRNAPNPLDGLANSLDFTGLEDSLNNLSDQFGQICQNGGTLCKAGSTGTTTGTNAAATPAGSIDSGTLR